MRSQFNKSWKASKQPRKQRKYRAKAPLHIKHKFLSASLNKELKKRYQRRSFPVRSGDIVKILRGSFKKKTGKVSLIDVKRTKISIEKIQRTKKDGTKVNVFFHPSNLQITELNLDDKKRLTSIERKRKKNDLSSLEEKESKKEETKKTKKVEGNKEKPKEKK